MPDASILMSDFVEGSREICQTKQHSRKVIQRIESEGNRRYCVPLDKQQRTELARQHRVYYETMIEKRPS